MVQGILHNYETIRLHIENPEYVNALILSMLLVVVVVFVKRGAPPEGLMDRTQTEQLKGLAILLVILGHFWVHVADAMPRMLLGGDAVAVFFILSGYGLTRSSKMKTQDLKHFAIQRLKRVMVPYWIITCFIILLDCLLLKRVLPLKDTLLTFIGVNISLESRYIDYVRWYITLLLSWYIAFQMTAIKFKSLKRLWVLWVLGGMIFLIDYYGTHLGWYQIIAFPMGCTIGEYKEKIQATIDINKVVIAIFVIISLTVVIFIKFFNDTFYLYFYTIMIKGINEVGAVFFSIFLILLFYYIDNIKYYNYVFVFIGGISYEMFLLHGALLVRYNPIISESHQLPISIAFIVFVCLIILISKIWHSILNNVSKIFIKSN